MIYLNDPLLKTNIEIKRLKRIAINKDRAAALWRMRAFNLLRFIDSSPELKRQWEAFKIKERGDIKC